MPERFDLIVRGGTLVNGSGRRPADIAVRDGRIAAIGAAGGLTGRAPRILEATGRYVLPGLIDGHVHFREPGLEHKEDWLTGSRAAVMGGVTTVLEMPNTVPPTATVADVEAKLALAQQKSYCDYGLFGLLGATNSDSLAPMLSSGLVVGLKVFLGPTTGGPAHSPDDVLVRELRAARHAGLRVAFHAEDATIIDRSEDELRARDRHDALAHLASRPVEAEVAAIEHAGRLLAEAGAKGHILHLSSAEGLAAVSAWRERGLDLTCEVSAHHCFLTAEDYPLVGGLIKCNPPIREARHGQALLGALADGAVDSIASDHAPHAADEKLLPNIWQVAPGISGVETTLRLFMTHGVHAGRLSLEQLVRAFSERPAQAWGLWPRKGTLETGSDADLTIVDPEREGVIHAADLHGKHGVTPFEGWATRGAPLATIVRGRLVMEDGRLTTEAGWGAPVRTGLLG